MELAAQAENFHDFVVLPLVSVNQLVAHLAEEVSVLVVSEVLVPTVWFHQYWVYCDFAVLLVYFVVHNMVAVLLMV